MKEQLALLIQLQKIDSQLGLTKAEKARHPIELENAERPLKAAQKALEKAKSELNTASKTKRDKEGELRHQEETIEKLKARQSEIKTNKEYQAHLHELEAARQVKSQLEDELLNLMEESDNLNKGIATEEAAVSAGQQSFQTEEQQLARRASQANESITKWEEERNGLLKQLESKLLRNYERIKSARKDLAVVPIIGGICAGCHMNIPPQLVAEVKLEESIHTCSNCHRIMYWHQSPEPIVPPAEAKSLLSQKNKV